MGSGFKKNIWKILIAIIFLMIVFVILIKKCSNDVTSKKLPAWEETISHKGNVNGINVEIPSNWMYYYSVEYIDKREQDGAIHALSLYMRWPDLAPSTPHNEIRRYAGIRSGGESQWMVILIKDDYKKHKRPPEVTNNGLARKLNIIVDSVERNAKQDGDVQYQFKGINKETGLQYAVPVGTGTEQFHGWNMALYWAGNPDKEVTTLIQCYNGKIIIPDYSSRCEQTYIVPEFNAYVTVYYTRNLLSDWDEIQKSTHKKILSFIVKTEGVQLWSN